MIQRQGFALVEDGEVMTGVAARRMTSDMGSRVPPPVSALPAADSRSFSVVDTMIDAGNPLCWPNFPDAKTARMAAFTAL